MTKHKQIIIRVRGYLFILRALGAIVPWCHRGAMCFYGLPYLLDVIPLRSCTRISQLVSPRLRAVDATRKRGECK